MRLVDLEGCHLKSRGSQELSVVAGVGVVQSEGCDRVPWVVALREHGEISDSCEQCGNI